MELIRKIYRLSGKKDKSQAYGICLPINILNLWGWKPKDKVKLCFDNEIQTIKVSKK